MNISKPNELKSVLIKEQQDSECWAHAIRRNFVRTLQILGVIKSKYNESFYNLFFSVLTINTECDEGGDINRQMGLLYNFL